MELGAPVEICGCELGTVPRQGDPPREVGRDIMATGINITADLFEATNRAFTGPPNVSADSPIFPSQSGQPDFPELLPNRNGLIVPNGLGLAWGRSIRKSSTHQFAVPCGDLHNRKSVPCAFSILSPSRCCWRSCCLCCRRLHSR